MAKTFSQIDPLAGPLSGDESFVGIKPSGSESDDEDVLISLNDVATYVMSQDSNVGGGGNAFGTISVSGQSDVVADASSDTLTFVAGPNITLTTNAGTNTVTIAATGGSGDLGVIHCYEEQPSGTDGGNSVAAWTTRVLNTTKSNTIASASLSSNQISLPAGTYDIHARVPCFANASSTGFKARLYDATAAATLIDGTSSWASANAEMSCFVQGRFTLSGTSNVRIEMIATAVRTSGWGVNSAISSVPNHFTDVMIRRVA